MGTGQRWVNSQEGWLQHTAGQPSLQQDEGWGLRAADEVTGRGNSTCVQCSKQQWQCTCVLPRRAQATCCSAMLACIRMQISQIGSKVLCHQHFKQVTCSSNTVACRCGLYAHSRWAWQQMDTKQNGPFQHHTPCWLPLWRLTLLVVCWT